uniref:Ribosome receptor lysine/proline rich domain-containing protein n=1 Tax=Salvator merianae TaxID=96440 RepID=A0A8D0EDX7_SALMN
MDFYDSQALGVIVFGGFMLVSAVGIFLVSTLFMKETSYEEALAKQRKELGKASQQKAEKKKKEKPIEKKGKAKKKEEKPNERISEPDSVLDGFEDYKVASEPVLTITPSVLEAPVVSAPSEEKEKDKKKVKKATDAVLSLPVIASKYLVSDVPKKVPAGVFPFVEAHQKVPLTNSVTEKKLEAEDQEEVKHDMFSHQKAATKKKKDPSETRQLIELLTKKAEATQDPWLVAAQKGDPSGVLKQQFEEKEKQLAMEQENLTVAKAKLREISKELAAEKAKNLTVEYMLKEEVAAHQQKMSSLQAQLETDYKSHKNETQQLQEKIQMLQDQLENGPNAQLARLQQENSILRDALNQATSQTESKQNTELAKLRQECSKLGKELAEKTELIQLIEQQKKALEMKGDVYEKQICQLQVSLKEKEASLQKSLNEISEKLCKSQASCQELQAELKKTKEQHANVSELQSKLLALEMEVKSNMKEIDALQIKLAEATSKNLQLAEVLKVNEAFMKEKQIKETKENKDNQKTSETEASLLELSFQKSFTHVPSLENVDSGLKDVLEQLQTKNNEMELSLRQANETSNTLQVECDQYRTVLAETERMLKDLQKSVEEEEKVWAAKLSTSEEELQKLKEYASLLEARLKNHLATADSERQNYTKEIETLRLLLSESQERLNAAKQEAFKQSQELSQAQDLACSLQVELEKERVHRTMTVSAKDDVLQLQETLDKEKKLTKDLGCAATKLKELLKITQEQLAKEREMALKLQQELQEKGENEERAKEGTSV